MKGGESQIPILLENLRAELAGQSGRDCEQLFSNCSSNDVISKLLSEVKEELRSSALHDSQDRKVRRWKPISVSLPSVQASSRKRPLIALFNTTLVYNDSKNLQGKMPQNMKENLPNTTLSLKFHEGLG